MNWSTDMQQKEVFEAHLILMQETEQEFQEIFIFQWIHKK